MEKAREVEKAAKLGKKSPGVTAVVGGKLANAVSVRQHRSPSFQEKTTGEERAGSSFRELCLSVGAVARGSQTRAGRLATPNDSGRHQAGVYCVAADSKLDNQQPLALPHKEGVGTKLHRSPSEVLRRGVTLDGQSSTATPAPESVLTPRPMTCVPNNPTAKAERPKTSTHGISTTQPKVSGPASSSSEKSNSKPGEKGKNKASSRSSSAVHTPSSASKKADRDVATTNSRAAVTTVSSKKGSQSAKFSTASIEKQSCEGWKLALASDAQAEKRRTQRYLKTQLALIPEPLDSDNDSITGNSDVSHEDIVSGGGYFSDRGRVASLLENRTPFERQPGKRRTLSERVLRPTATKPPKTLSPPLIEQHFSHSSDNMAPAPHGKTLARRPIIGPVNPRAMYGNTARPVEPGEQTAGRRPSSEVLSQPSILDEKEEAESVTRGSAAIGSNGGKSRQLAPSSKGRDKIGETGEFGLLQQVTNQCRGSSGGLNSVLSRRRSSGAEEGVKNTEKLGNTSSSLSSLLPKRNQHDFMVEKVLLKRENDTKAGVEAASVGEAAVDKLKSKNEADLAQVGSNTEYDSPISDEEHSASRDRENPDSDIDDMAKTQERMTWEDRLRTMAGIKLGSESTSMQQRRSSVSSRKSLLRSEAVEEKGRNFSSDENSDKQV